MPAKEEKFLEKLTKAFSVLEKQSSVSTKDFIDAIEKLFPVFDHLGESFHNDKFFGIGVTKHREWANPHGTPDVQHKSTSPEGRVPSFRGFILLTMTL